MKSSTFDSKKLKEVGCMGTSKLTEAARFQLENILKAWCLIIEFNAHPMSGYQIEQTIGYGHKDDEYADLRQWDRWKAGQLPSRDEFKVMNNLAVNQDWMPKDIGDFLVKIYSERSGNFLENGSVDGWGQLEAISKCEGFATLHNFTNLLAHCGNWRQCMEGPDESDLSAMYEWGQIQSDLAGFNEKEAINEWVDFYLWQAINAVYYAGAKDPFLIVKARLKVAKKDCSNERELVDPVDAYLSESINEAIRSGIEDPFVMIKARLKAAKNDWPNVKKCLDKDNIVKSLINVRR